MSDYCHNRVPGNTFFFTVRLAKRDSALLTDHISAFGEAIRQTRTRKPFHVDAWVALPDHAHAIWTLPPGDIDCASRWRAVKIAFSKSLRRARALGTQGILWEPHFRQHRIEADGDYACLIDYIHHNPVRHGLCRELGEWQWSSWHRFMAAGWLAASPAGEYSSASR